MESITSGFKDYRLKCCLKNGNSKNDITGSTKQNIQLLILQDRLPLKSQTAAYPIAKNDMPISIMIAAIILFFASASFKRLVPKNTPKTMLISRAGAT